MEQEEEEEEEEEKVTEEDSLSELLAPSCIVPHDDDMVERGAVDLLHDRWLLIGDRQEKQYSSAQL